MGTLPRDQRFVRNLLEKHDLVLSLGADLLRMSVMSETEPVPESLAIVQIGLIDWELAKNYPATLALKADVRETIRALLPVLAKKGGAKLTGRAKARMAALTEGNWTAKRRKLVATLEGQGNESQSVHRRDKAAGQPVGRPVARRLNRAEYGNAVRDLLALHIDTDALLPADETVGGFDTIGAALSLSPSLLDRYLSSARTISRLAVGDPTIGPSFASQTYEAAQTQFQDTRISEDQPFGSRGGLTVTHHFPLDAEYIIRIRLRRNVLGYVRGLLEAHRLEIRLDGTRVADRTVGGANTHTPAPLGFTGVFLGDPEWERQTLTADRDLEFAVDPATRSGVWPSHSSRSSRWGPIAVVLAWRSRGRCCSRIAAHWFGSANSGRPLRESRTGRGSPNDATASAQ